MIGGIRAQLSGGRFSRGFFSQAISKAATIFSTGLKDFGKGVVSIVAGGAASVAAGGKFVNGAVTAAYGYLFNYCSSGCNFVSDITGYSPQTMEFLSSAESQIPIEQHDELLRQVNGSFIMEQMTEQEGPERAAGRGDRNTRDLRLDRFHQCKRGEILFQSPV